MAVVRGVLGVDTQDVAFLAVMDAGVTQTAGLSVEPGVRAMAEVVKPRAEFARLGGAVTLVQRRQVLHHRERREVLRLA
jgi:hypothetical protein